MAPSARDAIASAERAQGEQAPKARQQQKRATGETQQAARQGAAQSGPQAAAERTQGEQAPKARQQQKRTTGETQQAAGQGGAQSEPCVDTIPNCAGIVAKTPGACQTAPVVKMSCPRACGLCGGGGRKDEL